MINKLYEKEINIIHTEMELVPELMNTEMQRDFNQFKSVLLSMISVFKYSDQEVWNVTSLCDIVETMVGKLDYNLFLKAVNYLSSNKMGILNLNFIYFCSEDNHIDISAMKYSKLMRDEIDVLTEEDLLEIGGIDNYKKSKLGFYCTLNEVFEAEVESESEKEDE